MSKRKLLKANLSILVVFVLLVGIEAGVIKDLYNKFARSNSSSKSEDLVEQSAPICGHSLFSSLNKESLSPEVIFITNRGSRSEFVEHSNQNKEHGEHGSTNHRDRDEGRESESRRFSQNRNLNEVAREYRFNAENVTLQDLERYGFNPDAPVTFLMHGFTSGYPLQAWISAIVEAYTINRESNDHSNGKHGHSGESYGSPSMVTDRSYGSRNKTNRRTSNQNDRRPISGKQLRHNLFIVNWNYAARGIVYPRAVANIPIVASYVTRFINEKILDEARVDPRLVQLIGHSLGAHLAGFIGKNTKSKLGRIYGLDPAGPCFGAITGSLYPSSKRLAPSDAEEVVTIHTNTALLGIDKPLGRHSVFVEGGSVQPGCKGGGVFKSISALTWDGGDFDTIACSHSRAPNLLTYQHDQTESDDDCQLVAYECEDWGSFLAGHCGNCRSGDNHSHMGKSEMNHEFTNEEQGHSIKPVECLRIGLDWQYPTKQTSTVGSVFNNQRDVEWQRPTTSQYDKYASSHSQYDQSYNIGQQESSPSRRTTDHQLTSSYYNCDDDQGSDFGDRNTSTMRPHKNNSSQERNRRASLNSSEPTARKQEDESVRPKLMFLRTGDTQPYCAYHYQVILELNEPFGAKKPHMSLLLQDSETDNEQRRPSSSSLSLERRGRNTLSSDDFGNKLDDNTYTHLLTGNKKLQKIDHGTILVRDGLPNGYKILKSLQINYMSHSDPKVRQRLSSRLCLAKTDINTGQGREEQEGNRFYFKPCAEKFTLSSQIERRTSRRCWPK